MSTMDLSKRGAKFIGRHEGFVTRWYKDPVGILTIGYGFTWQSTSFREWWRKNKPGIPVGKGTISREEAAAALQFLCSREYGKAVNDFMGSRRPPQHVFDGMVSPVYNIGARALSWKWAAACKRGQYSEGARLLENTATTAKGRKLPGLVRRRKEESRLIDKGIYSGEKHIAKKPIDPMADGILQRRERGPAVADLIKDLAALGYYKGRLDDLFGPGTESAVMAFQRDHGLNPDGYAGPKTLKAIGKALQGREQPVPRSKPSIGAGTGAAAGGAAVATGGAIYAYWSEFSEWACQFLWFCG